jgi:ADP-ribose pyrophosphatase YjhB (NUDIX family)
VDPAETEEGYMSTEPWDNYAYTALIVFCFLIKNGEILLIRRANEPYKGQITIPGGRKKRGESLREACAREMLEETGYTLKRMKFAGILHAYPGGPGTGGTQGSQMEFVSHYFICYDFEGEMRASEEGDLMWVYVHASPALPGIHPFYTRLLPFILDDKLPFEISVPM